MNWLDVKQHACSEVRASNLSGDCHWLNEAFRGYGFRMENGESFPITTFRLPEYPYKTDTFFILSQDTRSASGDEPSYPRR